MILKTEAGWRRMFVSAALFNWSVAASCGLAYPWLFPALGIAPMPVPALYFHLFMAAVAVFGYAYFRVARDLTQAALAEVGAVAKLAVFALVGAYWIVGIASWHLLALACVDFVYAILFIDFIRSRKSRAGIERENA